ncbi:hypothetical protein TNCV_1696931 [Trichonephila clavipes]|nr:hypothetical protein TNCV_1696931 [Trichonephila clavipes]
MQKIERDREGDKGLVNLLADPLNARGGLTSSPQSPLIGECNGSAHDTPCLRPNFIGSVFETTGHHV